MLQPKKAWQKHTAAVPFVLLVAVAFLLASAESAWTSLFGVAGFSVPLLLVFCVCLGLYAPFDRTWILGALCGVCSDLAKGGAGFDCLLYLYISAGCVWLGKRFHFRKLYEGMAVAFLFVWLYGMITYFTGRAVPWILLLGNAGVGTLFLPIFRVLIRGKEV